ncbi:hypothetical protein L3556_11330 [Candidatus Synechococcus calcipolaris G9]|uniref:Uncharacterized protein n=1 Tax=Candidatus Synechococcus calcipolaris G9 TaxID=1497997 RepID=A0ABT6F155_9SYNE|nr:hypothetical protein [Candidatus Synechococcus calcipolaris]MDG2991516.1 hypothetical protein [Candidatus Synechococcus calcipolaris G9]
MLAPKSLSLPLIISGHVAAVALFTIPLLWLSGGFNGSINSTPSMNITAPNFAQMNGCI